MTDQEFIDDTLISLGLDKDNYIYRSIIQARTDTIRKSCAETFLCSIKKHPLLQDYLFKQYKAEDLFVGDYQNILTAPIITGDI